MGHNESPTADTLRDYEALVAGGLMTVEEVARFLKLSRARLYQLMDQGLLAYVKIGKARRIPHKAVVELAAAHVVTR